ncbi:MAG: hypothetical protein R6U27_09960 [Desulfobacterales bacterium]
MTSSARTSPFSRILPLPTATTSPRIGFSAAESGIVIPDSAAENPIRDHDPAGGGAFFFHTLHDHAIVQGPHANGRKTQAPTA